MSVEAIALVLHHSSLSGTAKLVLVGIANHEGDGGAWPSVETLAKYAGKDRRTVQRAVAEAVQAGELRVDAQAGGDEHTRPDHRPNRYRVLVRCPEGCDGTTNHRGAASASPRPNGAAPAPERGGVSDAHGAAPVPPEPSLEPSLEPAAKMPRARDLHFDAVARHWGTATRSEAAFVAKIARELKAAGATPEEIDVRAGRLLDRAKRDGWKAPTPYALTKHWTELARAGGHDPTGLNADRNVG